MMDELQKYVVEKAKKLLKEDLGHRPMILMVDGNSLQPLLLNFDDDVQKEHSRKLAKKLILQNKIERYFHISEVWLSKIDVGKTIAVTVPRRDINRKECLLINEFRKDREDSSWMYEFKRETIHGKERIRFVDEKVVENRKNPSSWNFYDEIVRSQKEIFEQTKKAFIEQMSKDLSKEYWPKFRDAKTPEERMKLILELVKKGQGKMDGQIKNRVLEDTSKEERLIRCPKCDLVEKESKFDVAVNSYDLKPPFIGLGYTLKCECGHVFGVEDEKV